MLYFAYFLLNIFIFFFGVIIGSFLNVIIYRVPKEIPFWQGRSYCVSCGKTIKPYDLIPIISFFILRGRCRNCNNKFSRRYPLVEIITGLIALVLYWNFGISVVSFIYFTVSAILVAISFIDFDTMTIPNGLIITLVIPAMAAVFFVEQTEILSRVIGFLAISLPMFLLTFLIPDCFGGGDIKLIAVCGFILGWQNILLAAFIALILGGTYGVILILKNKNNRKIHIAFGQYICIGVFVAMLYGNIIIDSYLKIFNL
ncbi:MAG TPA: prepilin peptidase [Clostridiales bacterium]|nr:prepilin peptidase [Clostridiales bacterium]